MHRQLRTVCVLVIAGVTVFATIGVHGGAHALREQNPGIAVANAIGAFLNFLWNSTEQFFNGVNINGQDDHGDKIVQYFQYVSDREISVNGHRMSEKEKTVLNNQLRQLGENLSTQKKQCVRRCTITEIPQKFIRALNPHSKRVVLSWGSIDRQQYTPWQQHLYNAMNSKITLKRLKELLGVQQNANNRSVITEIVSECARVGTLFQDRKEQYCTQLFEGTKGMGAAGSGSSEGDPKRKMPPPRKSMPPRKSPPSNVAGLCTIITSEIDDLMKNIDGVLQNADTYFSSNKKSIPAEVIRKVKEDLRNKRSELEKLKKEFLGTNNDSDQCMVYSARLAAIKGDLRKLLRPLNTDWNVLEKVYRDILKDKPTTSDMYSPPKKH